jgi:hypothetical protein
MTRALAVVSLVVLAACAARQAPASAPRFESPRYPYAVYFDGGIHGMFAAPTWRLTNYDFDGRAFTPKHGITFDVKRSYDVDADGTAEGEYTEPFYEVALAHRTKDAKMWLRMVPLPAGDRNVALGALADRYVACVAGMGSPVVLFGVERATCAGQRFATRRVGTRPCALSGKEALLVDFEVANVAPDRVSETTHWTRARLALVRTGYEHVLIEAQHQKKAAFPVLMLASVTTRPDDFAALARDFDRFLQQVALSPVDGAIPAQGGHTCQAP